MVVVYRVVPPVPSHLGALELLDGLKCVCYVHGYCELTGSYVLFLEGIPHSQAAPRDKCGHLSHDINVDGMGV